MIKKKKHYLIISKSFSRRKEWSFPMPNYNEHLDNWNVKSSLLPSAIPSLLGYKQWQQCPTDTPGVHPLMAVSSTGGGSCPSPGFCHFSNQTQQVTPMWSWPSPFRIWEQQASSIFFLQRNKTTGKENLSAVHVFSKHFKIVLVQNPF